MFYPLSLIGLSLAAAAPATVDQPVRVRELEARLAEQENRIRALEAQLARLAAPPASAEPAPKPPIEAQPQPAMAASATPAADPASVKTRGRLQVDALVLAEGDAPSPTGSQVRRLYLGAEGSFSPALRFQAEADFAGNRVSLQDALLAYKASDSTELIGGYFKPPVTAEELQSDVSTLFLERSAFAGTFAPGRRTGLSVRHARNGWGVQAGIFGEREDVLLDGDRIEGWLVSARAHADLLPGDAVLHVASSGYYARMGSDRSVSLSQRPETNRAPVAVSTGQFEASHARALNGEIGYGLGPITLQAEGGFTRFAGGPAEPHFWGWSAQLGWRPTGEERAYDPRTGVFGRVKPLNPFGAIELGLRASHVNLDDEAIFGGRLTSYGAVVNWYPETRLRLGANFIHAETRRMGAAGRSHDLFTVRAGIDW